MKKSLISTVGTPHIHCPINVSEGTLILMGCSFDAKIHPAVQYHLAQGVSRKDKTVGLIPCCIRDDSRSIPNAFQKEFVNHSLMLERQRFGIERKRKGGIKPSGKCKEAE